MSILLYVHVRVYVWDRMCLYSEFCPIWPLRIYCLLEHGGKVLLLSVTLWPHILTQVWFLSIFPELRVLWTDIHLWHPIKWKEGERYVMWALTRTHYFPAVSCHRVNAISEFQRSKGIKFNLHKADQFGIIAATIFLGLFRWTGVTYVLLFSFIAQAGESEAISVKSEWECGKERRQITLCLHLSEFYWVLQEKTAK